MMDLTLRRAVVQGRQEPVDICIQGGRIVRIAPSGERSEGPVLDVQERLVLPGFVDTHMHLDKCLVAERFDRQVTTLDEARALMNQAKANFTPHDVQGRARRAILMAVRHGTTAIRTHVDVDSTVGLLSLEALLELREQLVSVIDLQFVLTSRKEIIRSSQVRQLFREAMRLGADLMGGTPEAQADGEGHLDAVFELASEFGRGIDLHVDETTDPSHLLAPSVIRKIQQAGYEGKVTLSHLCALSSLPPASARAIIEAIAQTQTRVITCPSSNLHIHGRDDDQSPPRGLTRVKELLEAGVRVAYGSDNIRDAFVPFGNADMLEEGLLLAHAAHLSSLDQLTLVVRMATEHGAHVLGLEGYGLEAGKAADLVVLDAKDAATALLDQSLPLYTIKRGRIVATNEIRSELYVEGRQAPHAESLGTSVLR